VAYGLDRELPNVSTVGRHGCCVAHPAQRNTSTVLAANDRFVRTSFLEMGFRSRTLLCRAAR